MAKRPPIPVLLTDLQSQKPNERHAPTVKALVKRVTSKLNYARQEVQLANHYLDTANKLLKETIDG